MTDQKLSAESKKVLKAFAKQDAPVGGKAIAEATGLDPKVVSANIKTLKGEGLLDSPVRCKYAITDAGKKKA